MVVFLSFYQFLIDPVTDNKYIFRESPSSCKDFPADNIHVTAGNRNAGYRTD